MPRNMACHLLARSLSRRQGDAQLAPCRTVSCHLSRLSYECSHACALHSVVVTSLDTLENNFPTFQNFRHHTARTTSPDPDRHASPRTVSRVLRSSARQIACHGVNRLLCQCETCFSGKNDTGHCLAFCACLSGTCSFRHNKLYVLVTRGNGVRETHWRFLPRDAMHKRALCRHAVHVCLSVCLSLCHVREFYQNE